MGERGGGVWEKRTASATIWPHLWWRRRSIAVRFFCSLIINPPKSAFHLLAATLDFFFFLPLLPALRQTSASVSRPRHLDRRGAASQRWIKCDTGGRSAPFAFDPGGATEGRTLTNMCQTKLLGTGESVAFPLDGGQRGVRPYRMALSHTHTHTWTLAQRLLTETAVIGLAASPFSSPRTTAQYRYAGGCCE